MSDGIVVEPAREVGEGPGRAVSLPREPRPPKERKVRVPRERPPRVKVENGIRVRDDSEKAKSWIATPEDVDEWFRTSFSWPSRKAILKALKCANGKEDSPDYVQRLRLANDVAWKVMEREYPAAGNGKGGKDISAFLLVIKERVVSLLPGEREQAALSAPAVLEAEVVEGEAEDG